MIHIAPTLLDAAQLPIPADFRDKATGRRCAKGWITMRLRSRSALRGARIHFRSEDRIGPRVLSIRGKRYKLVLHFDPAARISTIWKPTPASRLRWRLPSEGCPAAIARNRARHLQSSAVHRDLRVRTQARLRELQLEWKNPAEKSSPVAS